LAMFVGSVLKKQGFANKDLKAWATTRGQR
jgi:hypothetical protein